MEVAITVLKQLNVYVLQVAITVLKTADSVLEAVKEDLSEAQQLLDDVKVNIGTEDTISSGLFFVEWHVRFSRVPFTLEVKDIEGIIFFLVQFIITLFIESFNIDIQLFYVMCNVHELFVKE